MGWLAHEGCSALMPRLKKPVMVMLTISVPSASSQMPQSQLPSVSLQGSTIDGGPIAVLQRARGDLVDAMLGVLEDGVVGEVRWLLHRPSMPNDWRGSSSVQRKAP